jgi:VIT1/CCC1 family predicted Fe2+/Mn2+ transporter
MEHSHSRGAIAQRLARPPAVGYLRDWVHGGIDGAVTTFALVAGVVGAELPSRVVVILGIAYVVAAGFAMAAKAYAGTRAEPDGKAHPQAVETVPDGEREEIRQIFRGRGFRGADLERAVDVITADTRRWVDNMLSEESGPPKPVASPLKAAGSTFAAFMLCGVVPLLPFVVAAPASFQLSIAMTGVVFFLVGSGRSRWSPASWWRSGSEILAIGMAAAALAYLIGFGLKSLV